MALVADPVARRSVDVLLRGQSPSGALVASPSYPTYRYAWLRDGAFCAHALDVVGEGEASAAWHGFVAGTLEAHRPLVESAIDGIHEGRTLPPAAVPPARSTLHGRLEPEREEAWPNFQIDGYGMWLWALEQHVAGRGVDAALSRTIDLAARYLDATWPLPSHSCWEELDGGEHASTLGAVYAGLTAAARLLDREAYRSQAERVRGALLERYVEDERFKRGPDDPRLDGSLLWLGVPFGVVPLDDPRIVETVDGIRRELTGPEGGVYRYPGDTYYGGGEWLLLTCSLGWHAALAGDAAALEVSRRWVRAQALENGDLPEQVTGCAQDAEMVEPWVLRWGPVATPLLWSHAMYLLMETAAS